MKNSPTRPRTLWHCSGGALALLALAAADASAPANASDSMDFANLSLEELGAIKVTSVSKKSERLNQVPAAVTVITGDDIRRSGALTLPEALRLAPGVQVGRVDSAEWAVSIRGFNDTFSQKLLVLMDGRSLYTPLFSGTFWQVQDTMLEDVDRLEVVRGPGGTVWGANAVNGVINVVRKSARETQGLLLTAGGGSARNALAGVRYGGQLGEHTFFRLYGKYDEADDSRLAAGGDAQDAWWKGQGGFRLDWEPSEADRFTVQGDLFAFQGDLRVPRVIFPTFGVPPPPGGYNQDVASALEQDGGNLLGRWSHEFSEDSDLSLQTYYDRSNLSLRLLEEQRDTYDIDLRHRFQLGARQEIVWGGGYRLSQPEVRGSSEMSLSRPTRSDQIGNLFVQDELKLVPDRLRLMLGTKVEHNDYTGFEFEPGGRLAWTPNDTQTLWASVARAVRTPSQVEHDVRFNMAALPSGPGRIFPALISAVGDPGFKSENVLAYELGYRVQLDPRLSLDVATFVNDYDQLRSGDESLQFGAFPNYVGVENRANNLVHGQTFGGELAVTWQAAEWWRLHGQLTLIEARLQDDSTVLPGTIRRPDIASPLAQFGLRSSMDLGRQVELDVFLRYVDAIDATGVAIVANPADQPGIASYVTVDVRLAWHPRKHLELAVVGQNLGGTHREFNPTFISTQRTTVGPSVYGKVTWKF